ncbi:MAG: helix-turn-helix transcriptional regulator [Cytophagales bacterium]|nr:helix-turn-helix transcriptional regulator [Armatimonadota bacterium]
MGNINLNLRETHIIGTRTTERMVSSRLCSGLARRGIYLAGVSEARAPFTFIRHDPLFCQILVCLSGTGFLAAGGEWLRCEPGTAYLTPAGVPHAYKASPESRGSWEIAWVLYLPQGFGGGSDPLRHLAAPLVTDVNPEPLAGVIRGLYAEAMNGAADSVVLEEWSSLLDAQARRIAQPSGEDTRLRRLWAAVAANPAHGWTIDSLAEQTSLSGEQLRRLCARDLRRTPMQQIAFLRMRHAASLLASDFYSVEAVARKVGYENPFAFSTAFKRVMGVSPSGYRKERRGNLG